MGQQKSLSPQRELSTHDLPYKQRLDALTTELLETRGEHRSYLLSS